MESMSKWDNNTGTSEPDINKNVDVANRAFAMLICARVCVLRHLLKELPKDADAMEARRRWVLVQALPPCPPFEDDIFTALVKSLRSAPYDAMFNLARSMLRDMAQTVRDDIFPLQLLFAVIDEAQEAAVYLKDSFRSFTTGIDMRPVLHAFYRFLLNTHIFEGFVLAGTGLSIKMVKEAVSSSIAKNMGSSQQPTVFVELGRFTKDGPSHFDYIRKYIPHSGGSVFDQRLVGRIVYWLSGRWVQL